MKKNLLSIEICKAIHQSIPIIICIFAFCSCSKDLLLLPVEGGNDLTSQTDQRGNKLDILRNDTTFQYLLTIWNPNYFDTFKKKDLVNGVNDSKEINDIRNRYFHFKINELITHTDTSVVSMADIAMYLNQETCINISNEVIRTTKVYIDDVIIEPTRTEQANNVLSMILKYKYSAPGNLRVAVTDVLEGMSKYIHSYLYFNRDNYCIVLYDISKVSNDFCSLIGSFNFSTTFLEFYKGWFSWAEMRQLIEYREKDIMSNYIIEAKIKRESPFGDVGGSGGGGSSGGGGGSSSGGGGSSSGGEPKYPPTDPQPQPGCRHVMCIECRLPIVDNVPTTRSVSGCSHSKVCSHWWGSGHNKLMNEGLKDLTQEQLDSVKFGSSAIDKGDFQRVDFSYCHAMVAKGGTLGQTITEMKNHFIAKAIEFHSGSYQSLGQLLHMIQDAYSPAHSLKDWDGKTISYLPHIFEGRLLNRPEFNDALLATEYIYQQIKDCESDGETLGEIFDYWLIDYDRRFVTK